MKCTNAAMQAAVMYFTVINCLALQGTYDNCSDKSSDFCHFFVQFLAFWEFVLELPFQGIIGGLFWGPSRAHRRTPSTAQCVLCTVFSPRPSELGHQNLLAVNTIEHPSPPLEVTTGQSDIALWLQQGIFYYRATGLYKVHIVHWGPHPPRGPTQEMNWIEDSEVSKNSLMIKSYQILEVNLRNSLWYLWAWETPLPIFIR